MAVIWLVVLIIVLAAAGTAAWAGWRAAPFLPTPGRDVERMLGLAQVKAGETVYDLGAGDGRYIIAAAKQFGSRAVGFEISLLPYVAARLRLLFSGLDRRVQLRWQDFFRVDLRPADVVVCFLTPAAMAKLAAKFKRELRSGTRVISYAFSLPGWTPARRDKPTTRSMPIYLYLVP